MAPAERFYATVTVAEGRGQTPRKSAGGQTANVGREGAGPVPADTASPYRILLDGRPIRTPAKRIIEAPSRELAEALATEWEAQVSQIDPRTMPLTRLVNSALDGVTGREREVAEDIAGYAGNDLICYRAAHPPGLVARQVSAWDPILAWAGVDLGGPLITAAGIVAVAQDAALLDRFRARLADAPCLRLAALHVMTTLTGSALLAWAHARHRLDADAAWAAAHVDEDWQISQWGEDDEAQARRRHRRMEFDAASRLLQLAG